jgi:hypothetical protein
MENQSFYSLFCPKENKAYSFTSGFFLVCLCFSVFSVSVNFRHFHLSITCYYCFWYTPLPPPIFLKVIGWLLVWHWGGGRSGEPPPGVNTPSPLPFFFFLIYGC